jgi:hypothetical protein
MADEHFNYKEMMKLGHVLYTLGSQTNLFHAMNLANLQLGISKTKSTDKTEVLDVQKTLFFLQWLSSSSQNFEYFSPSISELSSPELLSLTLIIHPLS